VATTYPEGVVHPYQELGYKTLPEEGVEIVIGMELKESASRGTRHPVQLVRTEHQRVFFNSAIDTADPHGQMQPEELEEPALGQYYVELDGQCVCTGKAIRPFETAVTVEPLATHPGYRRRGIATSLMNRIHSDAVSGNARQSVIVASNMGVPLYLSLGYEVVSHIRKFVPEDWTRPAG
jgi:predicted GNAT family acetyltransferase